MLLNAMEAHGKGWQIEFMGAGPRSGDPLGLDPRLAERWLGYVRAVVRPYTVQRRRGVIFSSYGNGRPPRGRRRSRRDRARGA
jgi:hypothetical protein